MQETTTPNEERRKGGSFLAALLAGLVLAMPIGWFLAYLAALPAFMGLIFFMLMGLLVGASLDRVRGGVQVSRTGLWVLGVSVAVAIWTASLFAEYRQIPAEIATYIRDSSRQSRPMSYPKLLTVTQENYHRFLAEQYAPGGFPGYLRWAAVDGVITTPRVIGNGDFTYRLGHRRVIWIIRNILSLFLLGGAVLSQVLRVGEGQPAPDVLIEAREHLK